MINTIDSNIVQACSYLSRITVHVNANEGLEALQQSINLYRTTKLELERLKEVVAPIEIKA